MNWNIIFIAFSPFAVFISCSRINFEPTQSVADESVIVGKIITNYLLKYFSHEQICVSVIHPTSNKRNYFQNDIFDLLFDDSSSTERTYNILNHTGNINCNHRSTFNLIFVDDVKTMQ